MYLGRLESKYWPYWCWAVARSAVLSALLMTGAWASLPWGPLCACLRLGRSLTSAASSFDRVVVVAKVLRALRETLLALEARTMALSGLAMACFEAMGAVCGRCVGGGGGVGGGAERRGWVVLLLSSPSTAQLSLSPPMHWSSPMQHSAGVERGCCRLPAAIVAAVPSFDFVLRRRSTLSCPDAPHSIP